MTLCVSYATQNKQRIFPYTELTDWLLQDTVCLLRGTDCIFIRNSDQIVLERVSIRKLLLLANILSKIWIYTDCTVNSVVLRRGTEQP
jgi:hypothetical protein